MNATKRDIAAALGFRDADRLRHVCMQMEEPARCEWVWELAKKRRKAGWLQTAYVEGFYEGLRAEDKQ